MWWRRRPHCHCPSQAFIGPALEARTASGWSPSPPSGPAFSPHCGTSSGAEMRTDEKSLGFAWPFGDSCRPQPAAQTLQHRVQAAHSPATSPACLPRDTLCFCPDKPLATPPRVPLLGVPALSCLCALSALQNPAVFTTPNSQFHHLPALRSWVNLRDSVSSSIKWVSEYLSHKVIMSLERDNQLCLTHSRHSIYIRYLLLHFVSLYFFFFYWP